MKVGPLPAQTDMDHNLPLADWARLHKLDAGDRNLIAEQANQNIEYAALHCVAGTPPKG